MISSAWCQGNVNHERFPNYLQGIQLASTQGQVFLTMMTDEECEAAAKVLRKIVSI